MSYAVCYVTGRDTMYGCMEALGGVRYLNNTESEALNLSRIFRDLCVLATWEGTTNVLSADTLRALKHPRSGTACLEALDWLVTLAAENRAHKVLTEWKWSKKRLEEMEEPTLLAEARDIVFRLAEILMASLLVADAKTDEHPRTKAVLTQFLQTAGLADNEAGAGAGAGHDSLEVDTLIVFGADKKDLISKPGSKL